MQLKNKVVVALEILRCRWCGAPYAYRENLEIHERGCRARSSSAITAAECHEFGGGWDEPRKSCSWPTPESELRGKISWLLFAKRPERTDPEVLSIVVPRAKAANFDFLRAYTQWPARGMWKGETEHNIYLEILFYDTPKEEVGTELMRLLDRYREEVLKEEALYAVTMPVEETTLK